METGAISKKIQRGRHTTRHSELFHLEGSTYVMDTPGFTSLYIDHVEAQQILKIVSRNLNLMKDSAVLTDAFTSMSRTAREGGLKGRKDQPQPL